MSERSRSRLTSTQARQQRPRHQVAIVDAVIVQNHMDLLGILVVMKQLAQQLHEQPGILLVPLDPDQFSAVAPPALIQIARIVGE